MIDVFHPQKRNSHKTNTQPTQHLDQNRKQVNSGCGLTTKQGMVDATGKSWQKTISNTAGWKITKKLECIKVFAIIQ